MSSNVAIAATSREVQTELTLGSGVHVVVHKGKGKDVLAASRMVNVQKDGGMAQVLALAALKCTFDGERKTYEDILEMPDYDVYELMNAVVGKDATEKLQPSLPPTT